MELTYLVTQVQAEPKDEQHFLWEHLFLQKLGLSFGGC